MCPASYLHPGDVDALLGSVRGVVGDACLIVVIGLPDFSLLPFLPWPLGALFAWRSVPLCAAFSQRKQLKSK